MANRLTVLDVFLHGDAIGTLTLLPGDRVLFAFQPAYIEQEVRPTLSLSFKGEFGGLVTDIPVTQTRLPPFFANLLPEGPLRAYLADRAGVKEQREFHLLRALGDDLPGAITVHPAEGEDWRESHQDEAESDTARDTHDAALRFSLAGVQLKFSAIMEQTGGLTIPARGIGGSWIVKLPSATYDGVPENEFTMMRLAHLIGIAVPEVRLVGLDEIEGLPGGLGNFSGPALAVKRFDRAGNDALIHIEDFAQVFSVYPENKYRRATYRNIAEVLWAETGEEGISEFIRRLVFNALIGNADMHLKNWSLIYPDRQAVALAPGYDFVSTIPYIDDDAMALKLVRARRMTEFSMEALAHLAAKARLPEKVVLAVARETVARFKDAWASALEDLPVSDQVRRLIERHARSVPLSDA